MTVRHPQSNHHAAPIPNGVPGNWTLTFDEEFPGTALPSNWYPSTWDNFKAANVRVSGGYLYIKTASKSFGGQIWTNDNVFPVGSCAEARISFAGPRTAPSNDVVGWPAFWTSSQDWPADGEIDIAEGYSPTLTINYHDPAGDHNGPNPGPPGNWSNSFHTYACVREPTSLAFYWDGVNVYNFSPTADSGNAQQLILSTSWNPASGSFNATGTSSYLVADYVRVWAPANSGPPDPSSP